MNLRNRLYEMIKRPYADFELTFRVYGEDICYHYRIIVISRPITCRPREAEFDIFIIPETLVDGDRGFREIHFELNAVTRGRTVRKAIRLLKRLGVEE